jgi:hypothetical protein
MDLPASSIFGFFDALPQALSEVPIPPAYAFHDPFATAYDPSLLSQQLASLHPNQPQSAPFQPQPQSQSQPLPLPQPFQQAQAQSQPFQPQQQQQYHQPLPQQQYPPSTQQPQRQGNLNVGPQRYNAMLEQTPGLRDFLAKKMATQQLEPNAAIAEMLRQFGLTSGQQAQLQQPQQHNASTMLPTPQSLQQQPQQYQPQQSQPQQAPMGNNPGGRVQSVSVNGQMSLQQPFAQSLQPQLQQQQSQQPMPQAQRPTHQKMPSNSGQYPDRSFSGGNFNIAGGASAGLEGIQGMGEAQRQMEAVSGSFQAMSHGIGCEPR